MATTVADADVLVHPDVSKFGRELQKELKAILKSIDAVIDVDADTTKAVATVEKTKQKLESGKPGKIPMDADTKAFTRTLALARQRASRKVKVPVELKIDRDDRGLISRFGSAGKQSGQQFSKQFGNSLGGVSEAASSLGAILTRSLISVVASNFVTLAAAVSSGLGAITAMTVLLIELLPLVFALPGLLLGAAAAVGVAALAFKDFGEALSGDQDALKRLAPSAREVVEVLRGFAPELRRIQQIVQENVFSGLAAPIQNLGNNILPLLGSALDKISQSINSGVVGSLQVLNSEVGKSRLKDIFESTSNAVSTLSEALPSLTDAFSAVAAAGARIAEQIAPDIRDAIQEISDKVAEFADSGGMEEAFDQAKQSAEALLSIVKTVVDGFKEGLSAVGDAFSDSTGVKDFSTALERIADNLKDPTVQEGLKAIGVAAGVAALALLGLAGGILFTVGLLSQLGQKILEIRENVFVFIGETIISIGNFVTQLGQKFGAIPGIIGGAIGAVVGLIGSVFTQAFNTAKSAVTAGISAVVSFVSGLPGRISAAIQAVVSILGNVFTNAFNAARNAVSSGINAVIALASAVGGRIKSAVGNLGSLLLSAGRAVIEGLIKGINDKFAALKAVAGKVAGAIKNLFPNSPAKEGPLSGHGDPTNWGEEIVRRIATGFNNEQKTIRSVAARGAGNFGAPFAPLGRPTRIPESSQRLLDPVNKTLPAGTAPSGRTPTPVNKTLSPTINVTTAASDPEIVANKILRRLVLSGAF